MQRLKIGKKFPWKTALLAIFVVVLGICLVGILLMGADAFFSMVIGGAVGLGAAALGLLVTCFTNMFFLGGLGVGLAVFFIYFYRKNYAKHTVLTGATGLGASGIARDTLAEPALFDDDMKVESA